MTLSTQARSGRSEGPAPDPFAEHTGRPTRRRGRRRHPGRSHRYSALLLAAAGAALLLAATVFGYRFMSHNVLGPQAVVEDYLTALASWDQAAALSLLPETRALVPADPAVYPAAGQRITGFEILGQEISGGKAEVQALVDRNGNRSTVGFRLKDDGTQAIIFTAWQLEPTAARTVQVEVPAGTGRILINGTELDLPPGESPVDVLLLPGSYLFEGPRERYLSYGPGKTVVVDPGMAGNPNPVRLHASANAELEAEVHAQADAYLAQCLHQSESAPAACPNVAYTGYGPERIRELRWELVRAPEYRITGTAESGLVLYAAGGKARAQYQEDTNGAGRWESRSDLVNISFSSAVEVAGESLGLDFRP